jgi:hypothetical protein
VTAEAACRLLKTRVGITRRLDIGASMEMPWRLAVPELLGRVTASRKNGLWLAHRKGGPLAGMPLECGSRHACTRVDERFEMMAVVAVTADVESWARTVPVDGQVDVR